MNIFNKILTKTAALVHKENVEQAADTTNHNRAPAPKVKSKEVRFSKSEMPPAKTVGEGKYSGITAIYGSNIAAARVDVAFNAASRSVGGGKSGTEAAFMKLGGNKLGNLFKKAQKDFTDTSKSKFGPTHAFSVNLEQAAKNARDKPINRYSLKKAKLFDKHRHSIQGGIGAKVIVHMNGPDLQIYDKWGRKTGKKRDTDYFHGLALRKTYKNGFKEAERQIIELQNLQKSQALQGKVGTPRNKFSIAIPMISTGRYGFDPKKGVDIGVEEIAIFIKKMKNEYGITIDAQIFDFDGKLNDHLKNKLTNNSKIEEDLSSDSDRSQSDDDTDTNSDDVPKIPFYEEPSYSSHRSIEELSIKNYEKLERENEPMTSSEEISEELSPLIDKHDHSSDSVQPQHDHVTDTSPPLSVQPQPANKGEIENDELNDLMRQLESPIQHARLDETGFVPPAAQQATITPVPTYPTYFSTRTIDSRGPMHSAHVNVETNTLAGASGFSWKNPQAEITYLPADHTDTPFSIPIQRGFLVGNDQVLGEANGITWPKRDEVPTAENKGPVDPNKISAKE
jgi:hypothetical protein